MLLLTKLSYSGFRVAYVIHRQEELNEFIHNSSTNELLLINDFANHCFCMPALNDVLDYFGLFSGSQSSCVSMRWAMYYLMISIAGRQVRCISLVLKSN